MYDCVFRYLRSSLNFAFLVFLSNLAGCEQRDFLLSSLQHFISLYEVVRALAKTCDV